jgi:hypothetical protein
MSTTEQQHQGTQQEKKEAYIQQRNSAIASAIEKAKAKNARLRLLKERHQNYLAERAEEIDEDEL